MNYFSGLPKSVRVGPYVIPLQILDELGDDVLGDFSFGRLAIRLATTQPSSVFAVDTVLHELFHAIWKVYNIKQGDDEERIVTTMAMSMVQLFHDNPGLVSWLGKNAR